MIIRANSLIDTVIPLLDEIETYMYEFRRVYPDKTRPVWVASMSDKLQRLHQQKNDAERQIYTISAVTDLPVHKIYEVTRIARKWYNRTNWQFCLSHGVAEKLLQTTTA